MKLAKRTLVLSFLLVMSPEEQMSFFGCNLDNFTYLRCNFCQAFSDLLKYFERGYKIFEFYLNFRFAFLG